MDWAERSSTPLQLQCTWTAEDQLRVEPSVSTLCMLLPDHTPTRSDQARFSWESEQFTTAFMKEVVNTVHGWSGQFEAGEKEGVSNKYPYREDVLQKVAEELSTQSPPKPSTQYAAAIVHILIMMCHEAVADELLLTHLRNIRRLVLGSDGQGKLLALLTAQTWTHIEIAWESGKGKLVPPASMIPWEILILEPSKAVHKESLVDRYADEGQEPAENGYLWSHMFPHKYCLAELLPIVRYRGENLNPRNDIRTLKIRDGVGLISCPTIAKSVTVPTNDDRDKLEWFWAWREKRLLKRGRGLIDVTVNTNEPDVLAQIENGMDWLHFGGHGSLSLNMLKEFAEIELNAAGDASLLDAETLASLWDNQVGLGSLAGQEDQGAGMPSRFLVFFNSCCTSGHAWGPDRQHWDWSRLNSTGCWMGAFKCSRKDAMFIGWPYPVRHDVAVRVAGYLYASLFGRSRLAHRKPETRTLCVALHKAVNRAKRREKGRKIINPLVCTLFFAGYDEVELGT